jgi:D-alanine-D-alanine ligase
MIIGVLWRQFRNVEFQRKISDKPLKDDAKAEALQHHTGLLNAGYHAILIEWTDDPQTMIMRLQQEKIDLVFNASSFEELCFLETYKIPYVGTGLRTVAMDKAQRKILAAHAGVMTPKFIIATHKDQIPHHDLQYPLFVKPLNGRGSAGIDETNIIRKPEDLLNVVAKITEGIGQAALIEEFIQGREITVGIIKTQDPMVLPILEIGYSYGETNTFEHKMLDQEQISCPADLSIETMKVIKEQVLLAWNTLNIQDFGRIDLILDQHQCPYFLEVNTFAGLTYPDHTDGAHIGYMGVMAKTAGLSQAAFLAAIIDSAIQRYPILKPVQ